MRSSLKYTAIFCVNKAVATWIPTHNIGYTVGDMRFNQTQLNKKRTPTTDTLRYVTVFHLFNFDALIMNHTKESFYSLSECEKSLEKILNEDCVIKGEKTRISSRVYVNFFSETITLISAGNTNQDCIAMLTTTARLMGECIAKQILASAHMHYGHFYMNEHSQTMCGKPYIIAKQEAQSMTAACITCNKVIQQNLEEARFFTGDNGLLKKMGACVLVNRLLPTQDPLKQSREKDSILLDWPRVNLDVFEKIKEYSMEEFYKPFERIYGPFNALKLPVKTQFENTLNAINQSLSHSVRLFNATL